MNQRESMNESFEYFEDIAISAISEILADLTCDTTHIEELATTYDYNEMMFADLEESHPHLYQCYDNIVTEIYERLECNDLITENFAEDYPTESMELDDEIDDAIDCYLEMIEENIKLLAS